MYKEFVINSKEDLIGSLSCHLNIEKTSEIVKNYFIQKQKYSEEKLKKILKDIQGNNLSIIMNISIEEEYQNQGYGNKLLQNFFHLNNSPTLLICDNLGNPWIEDWYKKNEFETIEMFSECPIMLKK